MKTNRCFSLLLIFLLLLSGCSDDKDDYADVDGLAPTIVLNSSNIISEPGREFSIKATVEDKDGLRAINLKSATHNLDKVIDLTLDGVVHSFDLDYKFKTIKGIEEETFSVEIIATDLGGRTTTEILSVSLDGDFYNPVFTVSPDEAIIVLLKTETRLNVKFSVTDNKSLETVTVVIPEINYSKIITDFTNSGKALEFNDPIILPSNVGTYNLKLEAVDKSGLKATKNSVITVSEMPDFAKMYLADVSDIALLNSDMFGVPMLIEHTGEYTYKARYYSEAAGTEVRFIPQKTNLTPICFGRDPANNAVLTDDPDISLPIILSTKGYYEIVFNVKTGEYTVNPYTPASSAVTYNNLGLVGSGLPGIETGWDSRYGLLLKQDPANPYIYFAEMNLVADKEIEFIIQTLGEGWPPPFWRWDRGDDPEYNIPNGGENPSKWKIETSGKYMFKFDSHLNRSKFYPIN